MINIAVAMSKQVGIDGQVDAAGRSTGDMNQTDDGETPCASNGLRSRLTRPPGVSSIRMTVATFRGRAYYMGELLPHARLVRTMERQKVLFLPHPMPALAQPWQAGVEEAIGPSHDYHNYDADQPMDPQFDGVSVVIDHGGSAGTRPLMDAGARAGVRFWQILGTGFDHFDLKYIKSLGIPVGNCPGQFSSVALAQSAMMFILMLAHRFQDARAGFPASWRVLHRAGKELWS